MNVSAVQTTQKPNIAKKAVKTVATAAVATGAVLYLAKTGKLNPTEGGNKTLETVKAAIKKPADKVLNSNVYKNVAAKVKPAMDTVVAKVKPAVDAVTAKVKNLNIQGRMSTLADKIEKVFNPAKFQ